MAEGLIREFSVAIHWRRVVRGKTPRLNTKRYAIVARSEEDAEAFALFRFERTHPGMARIEEVEVLSLSGAYADRLAKLLEPAYG